MRLVHGSSTSGPRSLGRVASRRDCLCRELDTDRITFHITFADDEHGVDFHLFGALDLSMKDRHRNELDARSSLSLLFFSLEAKPIFPRAVATRVLN